MPGEIALSTMWAIGQFPSLAQFFRAGNRLGFGRFELNHGIDSAMLAGQPLDGRITAVHEPCPADISYPELKRRNWLISSLDEENRRQGLLATRLSIDLAHELGVQAVVVHPGRVDIDPALEFALIDLYQAGKRHQPEYVVVKGRLEAARAAQAGANMRSVRRSLTELAEYAAQRGVRLGLENRLRYQDIPLPDELAELLDLGFGEVVGYWHDIGHAQVLQHLGLHQHEEWLRRFAGPDGCLIGVHLHDVVGMQDHLAAGLGQVDWEMVAGYMPAGVLRTCEFKPSNSPAQVEAGLKWLVDREV